METYDPQAKVFVSGHQGNLPQESEDEQGWHGAKMEKIQFTSDFFVLPFSPLLHSFSKNLRPFCLPNLSCY